GGLAGNFVRHLDVDLLSRRVKDRRRHAIEEDPKLRRRLRYAARRRELGGRCQIVTEEGHELARCDSRELDVIHRIDYALQTARGREVGGGDYATATGKSNAAIGGQRKRSMG